VGSRLAWTLLLCLTAGACAPGAASAASVSDVKIEIGQGLSKFVGRTTWRTRATIRFLTSDDGVSCEDELALERRVKVPVNGHITFRWNLIRKGEQREFGCADRAGAPKPVTQRAAVQFYHDPAPYSRILQSSRMRLRYTVRVLFLGQVAYRKTLFKPVTAATLRQAYRSENVAG
jgi:hypothetical protein